MNHLKTSLFVGLSFILTACIFSGKEDSKPANSDVGESWTRRNPYPTGTALYSITWTGSQLVAVGGVGAIFTSP